MNNTHFTATLTNKKINQRLIATVLVAFAFNFLISPALADVEPPLTDNSFSRSGNRVVIKAPRSEIKRVEKISAARSRNTTQDIPEIAKTFALAPTPQAAPTLVALYKNKQKNSDFSIASTGREASNGSEYFVTMTAYNSEVAQTDGDPCTTANGFNVCKHGIEDTVAANFLPMGTKITMPDLFPGRVFTVRDRTARRFSARVDVWMINRSDALQFGIKRSRIVVVD